MARIPHLSKQRLLIGVCAFILGLLIATYVFSQRAVDTDFQKLFMKSTYDSLEAGRRASVASKDMLPTSNPYVKLLGPRQLSDRKTKKVLLWTKAWKGEWAGIVDFRGCPVSDCVVTSSRSELDQSDVVAFYFNDMKLDDLPPRRSPHQVWLFFDWESPCWTKVDLSGWGNIFNWTLTYRRDADVYSPYGYAWKRSPEERAKGGNSWESHNRTKFALWMASNCEDRVGRKNVVTELAKYVPVDTFGKCGEKQLPEECGRYRDVLCPHLLRDYKFYLAFENVICRDYLTEKVWNAYHRDQIPVVLGGGVDYEHLLPPNSYISLSQFTDIRALAEHLQFLASNPEEYNKYLAWKKDYRVESGFKRCSLCEAMHDPRRQAQVYLDLKRWVFEDLDTCQCHWP